MLVVTLAACALFATLGVWQWHRGVYRQAVWERFQHDTSAPQAVAGAALAALPRFTRVRVRGSFDAEHQILLDNRSRDGRPGYEVLTPLSLEDGRTTLLVNRGWVAFSGYRDRLPDVTVVTEPVVTLDGRLDQLPTAGLAAGRAAPAAEGPWPRVTSFPTPAELSAVLGRAVADQQLLLDPLSGPGFERRWQPPGVEPTRNFSYAIQWWSFGAIALGLFVFLNLKRRR